MPRKPSKPSKASIKRAADRAEGKTLPEYTGDPADIIRPAPAKVGHPTSYRDEFAPIAKNLCHQGYTDQEIADYFQVSIATINNWKHNHPEFLDALKTSKYYADERVERSLYHKAIGYSFEAEEVFQYQGEIIRAKVRKHVPPDTTSMIFWLKNRRKDQWRDVQQHEHGRVGDFGKLSDAELVQELARSAQLLLEHQPTESDDGEPDESGG